MNIQISINHIEVIADILHSNQEILRMANNQAVYTWLYGKLDTRVQ